MKTPYGLSWPNVVGLNLPIPNTSGYRIVKLPQSYVLCCCFSRILCYLIVAGNLSLQLQITTGVDGEDNNAIQRAQRDNEHQSENVQPNYPDDETHE